VQCFAEKQALGQVDQSILDTQVNPAVWEISGHIVLKQREDYDRATEDYAWKLLAEVSLSEERFSEVKDLCIEASWKESEVIMKDHMFLFMPDQNISGKKQSNFTSISLQEAVV
jgi:GDP-L-galactose phosphorylase